MRKRLVLFVEGEGDAAAVPVLVKRLITESHPDFWSIAQLDLNCDVFRVGNANHLAADGPNNRSRWTNQLSVAARRGNLGAVLLLLDGDLKKFGDQDFCARTAAKFFAQSSESVGGGKIFSVAVVFARQEYESWFIAGWESLPGQNPEISVPPAIEEAPRNAAGWLNSNLQGGYKKISDQLRLTQAVDLQIVRNRGLRSFRRLENALFQLIIALRTGTSIATPADAPPTTLGMEPEPVPGTPGPQIDP
jgi:hypothetical protein